MSDYQYFTFLHVVLVNRSVNKLFVRTVFGLIFTIFYHCCNVYSINKLQLIIVIIYILRLFVCVIYVFITPRLLFIQTYN